MPIPFSFTPRCDLPPENVKFVSTPNVRSTLDIVWTCFSILLLCTWSVQHLNIQPAIKARRARQYLQLIVFLVKRKAKWMLLTLIAPEILIGLTLSQFVAARFGRDTMRDYAREDGVEWTLEHSFFADMGGFVVKFGEDSAMAGDGAWDTKSDVATSKEIELTITAPSESSTKGFAPRARARTSMVGAPTLRRAVTLLPRGVISVIKTPKDPRTQSLSATLSRDINDMISHETRGIEALRNQWASSHEGEQPWKRHTLNMELVDSIFTDPSAAIEDYASVEVFYESLAVLSGNLWVLNAQQLFLARKFGIIKQLPNVSMEEIEDKNKGDVVIKILALLEVAWLIIQLIVRKLRNLPSTQLEVMALAFAGSTFVIYVLLVYKPQDAMVPMYLMADAKPTRKQLLDIARKRSANTFGFQFSRGRAPFWIPDNSVHDTGHRYRDFYFDLGVGAGACLFGALHLLSWNQHFPTPTEKMVWRICLCFAVGIPPLFLFMTWATLRITHMKRQWLYWCHVSVLLVAYILLPVLYVLSRSFVLVEVFRSLAYLPSRTFIATFTAEIPHIA